MVRGKFFGKFLERFWRGLGEVVGTFLDVVFLSYLGSFGGSFREVYMGRILADLRDTWRIF